VEPRLWFKNFSLTEATKKMPKENPDVTTLLRKVEQLEARVRELEHARAPKRPRMPEPEQAMLVNATKVKYFARTKSFTIVERRESEKIIVPSSGICAEPGSVLQAFIEKLYSAERWLSPPLCLIRVQTTRNLQLAYAYAGLKMQVMSASPYNPSLTAPHICRAMAYAHNNPGHWVCLYSGRREDVVHPDFIDIYQHSLFAPFHCILNLVPSLNPEERVRLRSVQHPEANGSSAMQSLVDIFNELGGDVCFRLRSTLHNGGRFLVADDSTTAPCVNGHILDVQGTEGTEITALDKESLRAHSAQHRRDLLLGSRLLYWELCSK
jgi:hypothetical protein